MYIMCFPAVEWLLRMFRNAKLPGSIRFPAPGWLRLDFSFLSSLLPDSSQNKTLTF